MAKKDEEKTAFITSQGIFCYTHIPCGLRNAGATYQRLVDKAFHKQIGRNLEEYVDEIVIKGCTEYEIVRDIEETFKILREINMKLNPKKCTFAVDEGMFQGYKFNTKGLKVCPDKVDVVLSLPSPKCLKDVQKLKGKLASLNRHRVSVKGQILADFVVERQKEDSPDNLMEMEEELHEPWILFTNRSSCTDGSGAGLILTDPEGMYALRFRFDATNNKAEYETLIFGLRIAEQIGLKNLQTNMDSRLVANQVNGTYVAKEADMIRYLEKTNGLVERANHSLGEGIKARLDARSKNWMEELPYVLWTHRTMIKSSNGDTPFSLTYGTEAVIPTWIDMLTLKTTKVDLVQNNEALGINLDLLEEQKEEAAIREAKSKARMEKYYNSKVKNTSFKPGDLVYRNKDARRTEDTRKLGPK
ncbi:reverse transcriptase domain-containing protein [Tanacetum coccineum]